MVEYRGFGRQRDALLAEPGLSDTGRPAQSDLGGAFEHGHEAGVGDSDDHLSDAVGRDA